MATTRDYYDILGVQKTASPADIKAAYRKKALEWHPDRNKTKEAEDKFKEINQAYEILGNAEKKAKYDQFGHAAFSQGGGQGNPFGAGGNPFSGGFQSGSINFEDLFGGGSGGFNDPFDVFSSFFGGQSARQQKPHYSITLDFLEAVNGVEKTISHHHKNYQIKVPAGIDEGNRIEYTDFIISFKVRPHPEFQREGSDIVINQKISFVQAILGDEITVSTLEKPLTVRIRPGTQPNAVIRLSGKGVKSVNSSHRGDFYIRFVVDIPEKLNRKQKELLQEFKKL